jgi:hypothetical protein
VCFLLDVIYLSSFISFYTSGEACYQFKREIGVKETLLFLFSLYELHFFLIVYVDEGRLFDG